jgi:photosystem II stability/assembly factor-like uncharacterized protein
MSQTWVIAVSDGGIIQKDEPYCVVDTIPSGTNVNLNKIIKVESGFNQYLGYIVGDSGIILRSNSNGLSWSPQTSNTTRNLNDICFLCKPDTAYSTTGYAVGDLGTVLKTTNRGINWQLLNTGISEDLNDVSCFCGDTVMVFGDDAKGFKSTNGGNTWEQMSFIGESHFYNPNLQGPDLVESFIFDSVYSNTLTGFVIGENYVFKTTNGGTNWFPVAIGTPHFVYTIYFSSPDSGIVAGTQGSVFYTTNGGNNWYPDDTASSITNKTIRDIVIIDTNLAVAVGDNGLFVYVSTDSITIGIENNNTNTPISFSLFQNFPNPFNPYTNIGFEIPVKSYVKLSIYDINGRLIRILVNETKNRGKYIVGFNTNGLPSGVYFYSLVSDEFVNTKKMVLLK